MTQAPLSREGLHVAIGLPGAAMLVMGGIVGVGIFVNPAVVARTLPSPTLALAAWTLGGVIALLGAFVYAELAARIPATGGEYNYLSETYGPLAGFLFGWTTLLVVQAGGMAAVAIIFARNLDVLYGGGLPERVIVVGILAALAWINCIGVGAGNLLQTGFGVLKVVAIAAMVGAGLFLTPHVRAPAPLPIAGGIGGVKLFAAAMIPVVFSYGGWQTANYVAGEMRDPARNLARALIGGVLAVIALYLLVNIACLRALDVVALGHTLTPAADVLQRAAGPAGARLAAAAIALSAAGYLSQSMLTGPRVFFAMARDGLFFHQFARVSSTSHVPTPAILLLAGWTAVLALSGTYDQILSYDIAMNFLFFGITASTLFVLRRRGGPAPAYLAWGHPYSTALFILACAGIVGSSFWSYPRDSLAGYFILLLGVPPYLYWRRRQRQEPVPP